MDLGLMVQRMRDTFMCGMTMDVSFRKSQLQGLYRMYEENEEELAKALAADLRKPKQEALLLEIGVLKDDVLYTLTHMDAWIKDEHVPKNFVTFFDQSMICHDPLGVVLIISAWNYPLLITLQPLSGAIAAGNCVIIKPSELSPASSKLIAQLLPKYLDSDCFKVVCGGIPETTELLKHKFDHIFYTGSGHVGKIVREASNKYLTPTTLELGGKCPVYLDETVDLDLAVRRIMWGKLINVGQTCAAPDYLMTSSRLRDSFIQKAKEVLFEWYGNDPQLSPDLGRILNERHVNRLVGYLNEGKVVLGGKFDVADRWIEPTIMIDVPLGSKIMNEEIFGPILPIVVVDSLEEAIRAINSWSEPLSAYLFSMDKSVQKRFKKFVRCGSMCINDCVLQMGVHGLPFGGFGNSGMGAYHGKYTFDCFSHEKACFVRNFWKVPEWFGKMRYPPYSQEKIDFVNNVLVQRTLPRCTTFLLYLFIFGLGAIFVLVIQRFLKVTQSGEL